MCSPLLYALFTSRGMPLDDDGVDEHGETEILFEWAVLHTADHRLLKTKNFDKKYSQANIYLQELFVAGDASVQTVTQIQGADLNSLLRGIFALYGRSFDFGERSMDEDNLMCFFSGGIRCWEDVLETVSATLKLFYSSFKSCYLFHSF